MDSKGMHRKRRSLARAQLNLSFHLRDNHSRAVWPAVSRNLHPCGLQVEMAAGVPLKPRMIVELWPEDSVLIEHVVRAEVRWVKALDDQKQLCGLVFADQNDWCVPVSTICRALPSEASSESFAPFRFILDSIVDGIFSVDAQWRLTSFNRAAEKLTGWRQEDAIGRPCREVFKSSSCGDDCVLAQSIIKGKPLENKSVFITHASGKRIAATISAAPLRDSQGQMAGGVQVFRNVNALLSRSLILDNIADGVFTVDTRWRITSFNKAAEKITGVPVAEALGKFCSDIFHASICGETCAIAHSMCTGKSETNRCIEIQNSEGKKIPVSICAAPMYDNQGNLIGGVETFRDLRVVTYLQQRLFRRNSLRDILSKSPAMHKIFAIMPQVAKSSSNVLILGDSGTGKELVARALHDMSGRSKGPFVAVNCGALPDTLLEAELFGHMAGAFTDAKKDREGRFAAAAGGTLFLDEIGDISTAMQVKLLRVLENKSYEPLGSSHSLTADVRIVAATNQDLEDCVQAGTFRDDLFYRLNVVKIRLPSLRERMEDLPMLADHFVQKLDIEQNRDIGGVSEEALRQLMNHTYPGNVRELQNIIEYAFILCPGGLIRPEHLPAPFAPRDEAGTADFGIFKPKSLAEMEKMAISQALSRHHWKKMVTCRELGISKDTLRRKIAQYALTPPQG
ncbi:MAG: sigma 54-interacting transcriptional regulator [Desulfurivibrionaceae bacterium]|nr:sigma 54-interacting transcriptional regulator [Desulfurivibrionaceae bacterium]